VFTYENVIQKSNGNFVLSYVKHENYQTKLLEIDTNESVVCQFQSSLRNVADIFCRMKITELHEGIKLLDSEFNLVGINSL